MKGEKEAEAPACFCMILFVCGHSTHSMHRETEENINTEGSCDSASYRGRLCVCVCVCVCERERERKRENKGNKCRKPKVIKEKSIDTNKKRTLIDILHSGLYSL